MSVAIFGYELFIEMVSNVRSSPKLGYIRHSAVDQELWILSLHIVISNNTKHHERKTKHPNRS